jgi:hypothetical protein
MTAHVRYRDVEKTYSGTPEQVWLLLSKFFGDLLPTFEIAKKLLLSVDVQRLAEDCEGVIAFSKEGPNLMIAREKLTDNETLTLWLLANYVGFRLGATKKETVSKEELQIKLGKNPKIASTRLGELVKNEMANKTAEEEYRITTFGIVQMQKETLPKIKARIG